MNKMAGVAVIAVGLGACSGATWGHQNKGASMFELDSHECRIEAEQRSRNLTGEFNIFVAKKKYEECMQVRGWEKQ